MKAVTYTQYGPPDVLQLDDVKKPEPKDDEILVEIHSVSVSIGDVMARNFGNIPPWKFSMPFLFWLPARIIFGIRGPKNKILGSEFAGIVSEIGSNVKSFKVGDQVFGYTEASMGGYAEYINVTEKGLITTIPNNISFEEAATIPYGAITALNILERFDIQAGHKILINGASGGIGSYAVQLSKYWGAEVTGVCSTSKLEYVRALGADNVIDYTQQDFTKNGEKYDIILDILRKTSYSKCKNSLTDDGKYVLATFKMRQLLQMLRTKIYGRKKVICALSFPARKDLEYIKEQIELGNIKTIIDKRFKMEEIIDAHRYVDAGKRIGQVVLNIKERDTV